MKYKTCTKCGVEYEASAEFFHRQKTSKDGWRPICKNCVKQYCKDSAEKKSQYDKQYRKDNTEKIKQRSKQYYKNNFDKEKQRIKRWQLGNPEKVKQFNKQWDKDNPNKRKQINKRWVKNNPDKVNAKCARRRARKLEQTVKLTQIEQDRINFIYKVASTMVDYHVDHIKPLAAGGLDHPDNLQILHKTLNLQKGSKWPLTEEEQVKYNGFKVIDLTSLEQNNQSL